MAVPNFQEIMLPMLKFIGDGKEHSLHETIDAMANHFALSEEERSSTISNGQKLFYNRAYWAKAYLKMARLVDNTKRSHFIITERGKAVLKENVSAIDIAYLKRFPEFLTSYAGGKSKDNSKQDASKQDFEEVESVKETPEEIISKNHRRIQKALSQELLSRLKENSPTFFEEAVIRLLVKMGYGGSVEDAGKAIGKRGDEGIDGTIKEDKLGLDIIYVQAKRWEGSVGRPEIQKFVGALAGQGAKKGIFITTSYFTKEALEYIPKNETKIVLIDGELLADLMIENDLGVTTQQSFVIKKIDNDFFDE